jgi:mannonate dehydratase
MACHPDDPPTAGGGPGILGSMEGLQRLLAMGRPACHGLDLCTGAVVAMPGADLPALIRTLGAERVFMLHLANVRDDGSGLAEAFLDEGEVDAVQVLRACREAGFAGVLRPAHGPGMLEDTAWGHQGKAFSTGYLRAVLQTLERC